SLGLTNLIIKNLVKTGYIKIRQLNRRKIQYILTPKGFSEKAKKSYNYTLKTIGLFRFAKQKIQELILNYYKKGINKFIVIGDNEISDIIEIAFRGIDMPEIKYIKIKKYIDKPEFLKNDTVFLVIGNTKVNKNRHVNIVLYLSKSKGFL
ncbi:hypothetical protein KKA69_05930, partial [Patescibacteria group bacterium]|nr:hypothetical protein [Patescibacteria group bacterium]